MSRKECCFSFVIEKEEQGMNPALFAVTALFLYAIQNVIIERKLASISPIVNIALFCSVILTVAVLLLLFRHQLGLQLIMPERHQYGVILLCGICLFFADLFYLGAYHRGGSLITVSTIVVLFPVFASFIKFAIGGGLPSGTQVVGWVFAAVAVVLVSR